MITTKLHGYLDYMMGLFLIITSFLLSVSNTQASRVLIVMGIGTIIYSVLTNYELGIWKVLPLKIHFGVDIISGLFFLMAAPWFFEVYVNGFWLFVGIGLVEIAVVLLTIKKSVFTSGHM